MVIFVVNCRESLLDPERGFKGVRAEGLDFYAEHCTWKKLPVEVFDAFGGKEAAKAKRVEMGYGGKKSTAAGAAAEEEGAKKAADGTTAAGAAEGAASAAVEPAKEDVKSVDVKLEGGVVNQHPNSQARKRVLSWEQHTNVIHKAVKLSEVPRLFPDQLRSGGSSSSDSGRGSVVPNVTWTLLENK